MERDQIPVNVTVHRLVNGKLEEFYEGEDPVTVPHEVQALPGNKFTTRTLKDKGTYYIAVRANHPEYKLRTRVYDPPPYADPHTAVRTALDFIIGAGDSWHANTPRRGGILDRVSSVHQETSLCVGVPRRRTFRCAPRCMPRATAIPSCSASRCSFSPSGSTTIRARSMASKQQGAVWARVISAPANVLGRMSHLLDIYRGPGHRRAPRQLPRWHRQIPEPLLLRPRQAAARRDQRQYAAGQRARGRLVCLDRHQGSAHGRADLEGRGQEHDRPLLPDSGPRRDRPREICATRSRRMPSASCRCSVPTASGPRGLSPTSPRSNSRPATRCGRCRPRHSGGQSAGRQGASTTC